MLLQERHVYVCHTNYKEELLRELGTVEEDLGQYVVSPVRLEDSVWAQDILYSVKKIEFDSISQAAKALKDIHSHWTGDSLSHHRRASLIQEKLNYFKHPVLEFLGDMPAKKFGLWIMVNENTIYASADTRSPIPFGIINFNEDKKTPPSRAYLKLWETFTVLKALPKKTDRVIDLGSCPGGWSWVLSQVANEVVSVDKAPLDEKIARIKNIHFIKKDAFKLNPSEVGPVDWLFSDIICEPNRLYELVQVWKNFGVVNFVCTIKFKGKTDFDALERFKSISGSQLRHLYNNKHEITWILTP